MCTDTHVSNIADFVSFLIVSLESAISSDLLGLGKHVSGERRPAVYASVYVIQHFAALRYVLIVHVKEVFLFFFQLSCQQFYCLCLSSFNIQIITCIGIFSSV